MRIEFSCSLRRDTRWSLEGAAKSNKARPGPPSVVSWQVCPGENSHPRTKDAFEGVRGNEVETVTEKRAEFINKQRYFVFHTKMLKSTFFKLLVKHLFDFLFEIVSLNFIFSFMSSLL